MIGRSRFAAIAAVLAAGLLLSGCPDGGSASGDAPSDTLTRREKDSIVGNSGLPGSGAVREAIEASDRQKARAERLDSISGNE